jgi:hypothetical protein
MMYYMNAWHCAKDGKYMTSFLMLLLGRWLFGLYFVHLVSPKRG